jgi:hypothetical protein
MCCVTKARRTWILGSSASRRRTRGTTACSTGPSPYRSARYRPRGHRRGGHGVAGCAGLARPSYRRGRFVCRTLVRPGRPALHAVDLDDLERIGVLCLEQLEGEVRCVESKATRGASVRRPRDPDSYRRCSRARAAAQAPRAQRDVQPVLCSVSASWAGPTPRWINSSPSSPPRRRWAGTRCSPPR